MKFNYALVPFIFISSYYFIAIFISCDRIYSAENSLNKSENQHLESYESLKMSEITTSVDNKYIVIFEEIWNNNRQEDTAQEVRSFTNEFIDNVGLTDDLILRGLCRTPLFSRFSFKNGRFQGNHHRQYQFNELLLWTSDFNSAF